MSAGDDPLPEGTSLAHYVVRRPIGSGAMGTVYEAHDTALDRPVAVKVVREERLDGETADRFTREARAAARANHANLAHIYFVGHERGRAFYAMELVPGANLEEHVSRHGPLDLVAAIDAVTQAAHGLEAAHAVGVVHRDVKPSNLLRLPDGRVKVTDFGLAKSLAGEPSSTQAGQVLGTPTYMSPEQCRGAAVDARTDVYALGLTAWYLLAGRAPFERESVGEVIADQLRSPLPPLSSVRAGLPVGVDALLARLCAKDPAARPGSMAEVARAFEALRPRVVRPAPFATRAVASAIDSLLVSIAIGGVIAGVAWLAETAGWAPFEMLRYVVPAFVMTVIFLSQWGMEAWVGGSVAKRMFGIRVVRDDGCPASRRTLFVRFLVRFPGLPWMAFPGGGGGGATEHALHFSFGLVELAAVVVGALTWPFAKKRTLSDVVTHTRVAYDEDPVATAAR